MKWKRMLGLAALAGMFAAGSADAQWVWYEDFDSYTPGGLVGQSTWTPWDQCFTCDMMVVNTDRFTLPNGVEGTDADDIVHFFDDGTGALPTKGRWVVSCNTYMPSGSTGDGYFIMLNDYPVTKNWSVQVQFTPANSEVIDNLGGRRKLVFDRWVPLVIFIDLESDLYHVFYNGQALGLNRSWTNSFSGPGLLQIAVVDLYCDNGIQAFYYDDLKFEKASDAPLILNVTPKQPTAGQTLNYYARGYGAMAPGDPGLLFSWTAQRGFLMRRLLKFSFGAEAVWNFSTTVPSGLAGLELGQKVFGVPLAGGKVKISQEDMILFR